jgi:HlyD family secretion protein
MRTLLTLVLLIAVCAGVFALGSLRRGTDGKPVLNVAEEVALTVNTTRPEQGRITRIVQAPGDVEPVTEVEVSSEIVSKIVEMPVEEGDLVNAGDLLCRLDDKNLVADLESATARIAQLEAAVVQSQADAEKAERDLNRQIELSRSDATSDLELRDYRTTHKKAGALQDMRRHELAQAVAFKKRIEEDLKKTIITSPIDGVVARLAAKQGEVVVTGTMNNPGTVIMTVSDLSSMQVRARVDEVDVPLVRSGQVARAYLQSNPDVPVSARVVRVASKGTKSVGRDVVTFEALLEITGNEDRVKPGMTANVEIEVAERDNALTVPVEAVVHRMRKDLPPEIVTAFDEAQKEVTLSERAKQGQYIKVLYVMSDDKAHVRLVEAGIADTRRVEIVSGVALNDTVIVGPYRSLDQLAEGKKVALSDEDKKRLEREKTANQPADEKLTKDSGADPLDHHNEKKEAVAASAHP